MMTKEEIIELAEKAGIIPLENATNALGKSVPLDWLIEFSKLVRADYGKLHASLWLKRIDDAVKKERERIKEQNALEIEKINAYIKQLEDKLKVQDA